MLLCHSNIDRWIEVTEATQAPELRRNCADADGVTTMVSDAAAGFHGYGAVDEVEGFEVFGGGLPAYASEPKVGNKTLRATGRTKFQ
ncbi:hypothetical protein [Paenibacillus swuensis]|nr:hypothetical protein [Paenibacillus swuensis]